MADWAAAPGAAAPAILPRWPACRATPSPSSAATTWPAPAPQRRLGRPRFIDKAPWNFLHIGLIRLMLPNARIVDVRRHPLGCCVSAFRQHFAGGFDFAYDLADLGRYYADYVALMAHYDAVLPGHVHRVIYEDLVADTEAEVRRLLAYLGLPFDAACLRFFENRRPVATPSSEQVRRPIFTDARGPWRQFEPWLDPLKAALGPVLAAYPARAVAEALDPGRQDRHHRRQLGRIGAPAAEPPPVQAGAHLRRAGRAHRPAGSAVPATSSMPGVRPSPRRRGDPRQLALEVVHQPLVAHLDELRSAARGGRPSARSMPAA